MYRITKVNTGEDIGFVDDVRYIADKNGVRVSANKENATGIAYKSEAYSLAGTAGIDGLEVVSVIEVAASGIVTQTKQLADELLLSILKG